jgi:Zn-finger nucleic acid-binding protein
MKIRWTPDSVRFRISPAELQSLEIAQPVSAVLQVSETTAWSACISLITDSGSTLRFESGVLLLHLSRADLETLSAPENEGVYLQEGELRFIIEKDFPCAHPRTTKAKAVKTETFAPPPDFENRHAVEPRS